MKGYCHALLVLLFLCASVGLRAQYNPTNPAEPGVPTYSLTLQANPAFGGSFNLGTTSDHTAGSSVNLRAYSNSNYTFVAWSMNGDVISTSSSYTFLMPASNVILVANYRYDPSSPGEPSEPRLPEYSYLYVQASPSGSGSFNITSGNKYEVGSSVSLRATAASNFSFSNWTENGEVISTSSTFVYVVESGNPSLTANFTYSPGNPSEPSEPDMQRVLNVEANPSSAGYFNVSSSNSYQVGSSVYLRAYANQYYLFKNWTVGDSIVSTLSSFNYIMPPHNVTIRANYEYNYSPSNPSEPGAPSTTEINIYAMQESAVPGQRILFPVYLENTLAIPGIVVDIQFPHGFVVDTSNVLLSGRENGHVLSILDVGDNTYRYTLRGENNFTGNNGKLFDLPIQIPDTARKSYTYTVTLTHGVMYAADSTRTAIPVRSGSIDIKDLSENDIYARFSYDKLHNRVKISNMSSSAAKYYSWEFGDGTTSTNKDPFHIYANPGQYTIRLTVSNDSVSDVAEMSILINDESSWIIDGSFYLSDTIQGVRYFTAMDTLLDFIVSKPIKSDLQIITKAGMTPICRADAHVFNTLQSLYSQISDKGYNITFSKFGKGNNPILNWGSAQDSMDPNFVSLFTQLSPNLLNLGVDFRFWGVSFDPSHVYRLNNQVIASGEKTKSVLLSSIGVGLSYSWTASSVPSYITGVQTQGNGNIPTMSITNEGESDYQLVYNVVCSKDGQIFCQFDYSITITPSLVGIFSSLSPTNNSHLDKSTVNFSWNHITNAVYDLYVWDALNPRPSTPVLSSASDLQYTSKNFCQFGHSYKWQVVAHNSSHTLSSDTMHFSIESLPDLHVYALDCSTPTAGSELTIEWTVKNDGQGSTGDVSWKDYIWLVVDAYGGTLPQSRETSSTNAVLLASVPNVKALESGESYTNTYRVKLDERVYGNYYLLVGTDMYSITDIEWNAIGGSIINPYVPAQDGTSYPHLYAKTQTSYNMVDEENETSTRSDNFFYKQIDIAIPPLADLQVPMVSVEVDLDDYHNSLQNPQTLYGDYFMGKPLTPSPLTYSNLDHSASFYSGKSIKVTARIQNKGGAGFEETPIRSILYMANKPEASASEMLEMASNTERFALDSGAYHDIVFKSAIPYDWYGNTYFFVYTDINDAVYELAQTNNNWGTSDSINVLLTPGANLVPQSVVVPASISANTPFTFSYKVENHGPGIPFISNWWDGIYLSQNPNGLDDSAVLLSKPALGAHFVSNQSYQYSNMLLFADDYHIEGLNYEKSLTVTPPSGLQTGIYYLYVKVDESQNIFEFNGEQDNVLRSDTIRFVQPDLTSELISVSADTLSTEQEVAFTWKLRNQGQGDIQNKVISDAIYATVNQNATGGVMLATIKDTVWIAAGAEKTLRANVKIPKNSSLDGLRYLYVVSNTTKSVAEDSYTNNTSQVMRSVFNYVEDPKPQATPGVNLIPSGLSLASSVRPGDTISINFTVKNSGNADMDSIDVTTELFISSDYSPTISQSTPCVIVSRSSSLSGIKAGATKAINLLCVIPSTIKGGSKYLHLYVNRDNVVRETSTNDNHTQCSFILSGNLPDLVASMGVLSDTIVASTTVTLPIKVTNIGEWKSEKSSIALYLSNSNTLTSGATQLTQVALPAIVKGDSTALSISFTIADKKVGAWYLVAKADPSNSVKELNDDNNITARPIYVESASLPDLKCVTILADSVVPAGSKIHIKSTGINDGDAATKVNKWTDNYYLSESAVLNTSSAIHLGSKTHVGVLALNQFYNNEVTFTVPSTAQGNYMLFVITDASDAVFEKDENNNQRSIPIYISGAKDTPADLQVSSVNAPSEIIAGDNISISYNLSNVGEYAAEGNLHDVIYLSTDNRWDASDEMVGVVTSSISLHPGHGVTRTIQGRITNMPEGRYYVIVKTNANKAIKDTTESNNVSVMASTSKISFRDLPIDQVTNFQTSGLFKVVVPSGMEGKTLGLYLTHPQSATAGLYAAYGYVPSTAKYDYQSSVLLESSQEVLIPNVKEGTYYVLAQDNASLVNGAGNEWSVGNGTTSSANTAMSVKARFVEFGATSLSIREGGTGGWVTTDVNGALFDSIMDFRLKLGDEEIPSEFVIFNGVTSSRITFNLNDVATGQYDVVSELPDGSQATLEKAFTVVQGTQVSLNATIDVPNFIRVGSYAPFSITYANGGNTDCEVYDLFVVIDQGYLATTIQGLDNHESVVHIDLGGEVDSRGYKSIPPGEQRVVNLFLYQLAASSHLTIYLIQ